MGIVAFDIDGTLDKYPAVLGCLMRGMRDSGSCVIVISGHKTPATEAVWKEKAQYLADLGLSDAYDLLVAVSGPEEKVAERKALYLKSVGCELLIDNSERNAMACAEAGILALVPWAVRSEF